MLLSHTAQIKNLRFNLLDFFALKESTISLLFANFIVFILLSLFCYNFIFVLQ